MINKLPSTIRDLLVLLLGCILSFALLLGALPTFGLPQASLMVQTLLILVAALTIGLLVIDALIRSRDAPVDIWAIHRALMKASGQKLPPVPTMSPGLLLYYALTLEELAETGDAMYSLLNAMKPVVGEHVYQHRMLANAVRESAASAADWATSIRDHLATIPPAVISYPIPNAESVAIFDGIIDTTVTVSGMALAGGFPGRQGYLEVGASNLSKCNPITGVIEKDASGKWIKGPEFFKPDLGRVLHNHFIDADFNESTLTGDLGR